jgi:hypothetical protein
MHSGLYIARSPHTSLFGLISTFSEKIYTSYLLLRLRLHAGNRGDNIIFFPQLILIVTLKRAQKSNWGKVYDIFSPCVYIFSPLGHAIIVLLSQTVYWGENMARGKSNHTMFKKIWETWKKSRQEGT